MKIRIFADGAEKKGMLDMYSNPLISGFTTNPTLMNKAGIHNYEEFAKDILIHIQDKPISFEVFSDDFAEMERQALRISKWGENVYVKIPIMNTNAESSINLVKLLSDKSVKVNVTAIFTETQVEELIPALANSPGCYISVFAGRISDAGIDPLPIMIRVLNMISDLKNVELIWASPRELLNIIQANDIGCDIITVTNDILKKLPTLGKNLTQFSLETVQMFHNDAKSAGFIL